MIDRLASLLKTQVPERNRGLLFASGTTVPADATDGYQTGCIFQKTDGGDNTALYVNEGSVTSSDFNSIGDLTSVDYSAGGTTAITISGAYTVEGISITKASVHGIRVGAFTSGGLTTNAMVLDGTTSTAVEIHAGVSTDPGSGSNLRPLRSRFIVNTGGNVEAETYGVQGQLVVKSSNLGHWHGGVMGTIECQTALSVYNPLAGVGALVGRIGGSTITVDSSCYLAGVIALASAVGVSNSGVYAGLYVTKTSGASNFSHGAYIENSDIGIRILSGVTPNTNRTNHALVIGGRSADELTVDFAGGAGAEHYEPIQMNFDFTGTDPASTSTVNIWQGAITLDTDALASVRLKWTDLLTTVSKNVTDVYIHQAEIVLAGTTTISSEVAVLGLVLNAGSGTITCSGYRGINVTMRGSGTPANADAIFINVVAGVTVASAMDIQADGTITTGIVFDCVPGAGTITNLFSCEITRGPAVATAKSGDGDGSIKILVDGGTKYLQYWDAAS